MKVTAKIKVNYRNGVPVGKWEGGRVASIERSIFDGFCEKQGVNCATAIGGRVTVDIFGLTVRVVGYSVTGSGSSHAATCLVMREGALARARVLLRRTVMFSIHQILPFESRLYRLSGDISRYSLANILLNLIS